MKTTWMMSKHWDAKLEPMKGYGFNNYLLPPFSKISRLQSAPSNHQSRNTFLRPSGKPNCVGRSLSWERTVFSLEQNSPRHCTVNYFATPPRDQGSLTIPQFIHSRFEGCYCHCYSILLSLFKIHICLPSLLSLYGSTRKSAGRCRCAARCRSGLENRSAKLLGQLAYQCSGAVERNLQYKSLTERERCSAMTKANSECDEEKSRD